MAKRKRNSLRRAKPFKALNQPPGTITYVGRKELKETTLEVIDYNKESIERYSSNSLDDILKFEEAEKVTWFNVNGLNDTNSIEKLAKHFDLHPLIREDISNTNQRPKMEAYEDYLFIVVKMLYHRNDGLLINEHISIVLGKDYVLTFQEADGDVFNAIRERLSKGKGRIRGKGADYLMFSLLDAIIDSYFSVIEVISDKIETLEDLLLSENPGDDQAFEIQELKREILRIRRAMNPTREVVGRIEKVQLDFISTTTGAYLRDLHDHMLQITDNLEVYREMAWGLMDMYMTTISNRMNEVMKVLTIMASIFIPLTFIAGIYGMNFENMPELQWEYSYFVLWGIMLLLFVIMLLFFKRKNWL